MTGPVGRFFPGEMKPIPVLVSNTDRGAVIGGVGDAKTGGNYAASLRMSEAAAALGFSQVLLLDAIHGKFIEEVGAMNIFLSTAMESSLHRNLQAAFWRALLVTQS